MVKNCNKPYVVRLHLDRWSLTLMYICFCNKIPMDLMLSLYELYGKHALFAIKAFACKGHIRVSDATFQKIIGYSTKLENQVKKGYLDKTIFPDKFNSFIDYLVANTNNLENYITEFFFDLEDFYGRG